MSFLLSLLFVVIAAVTGVAFLGKGLVGLGRGGLAPSLRALAHLVGAGAAVLYALGMLVVAGAVLEAEDGGTDSSPIIPCRTGVTASDYRIDDYRVWYVPVRFVCHRSDGSTYDREVPGYVNPALAALTVTGVGLRVSARYVDERARKS
ncbi:hypothetical protein [Streptomyces cylindrosporus]|uniref:DUF3592 domain-containing protein n=1 Tax=Streptomyces cylindrosporus TaxID=2927583 RepID=A0ABS9Y9L7_9ACTN|nr:hypothetical protein [Streptomyces cylindrosporus]MCI3273917.1 hypothetical protein [Streptomyces cylindrosporus]